MMENLNHSSLEEQQDPSSTRAKERGGWKSVKYIIGNESFEKMASMSLIANITVYLRTKYHMDGIFLVNVVNIWSGSSNVASLAGAFISDAFLGRFKTLLFGSIASLLGMGTVTLTAVINQLRPSSCNEEINCQPPQVWQLAVLFGGLALLSIGAGGIRPCNIAFGADQFDTKTKKGIDQLASFFNWWYFSFTIALTIALTGVVYVQTNISWTLGFGIPTLCIVFSLLIFLLGRRTYILKRPQGSIFSGMVKVITAACWNHRVSVTNYPFYNPDLVADTKEEEVVKLVHTERFKFLDKAAIITNPNAQLDDQGKAKNCWKLCSLQQVEQFKCLVAILPVWLSGICCFISMDQQNTFGILQSMQMNRSIGPHFKIPPGWMNITSMVAVSTWIVVYERIYLTWAKDTTGKKNKRLTIQQRINTGIVMSILSMVVAGVVERHRRHSASKLGSIVSPITFAFLLPQFVLSGLTEAFAAVAIMEFLTMQVPESMRTVAGALFFLSLSIASYIGSSIVNIIHKVTQKTGKSPWLGGHDLNENKLDHYYFIIAGLSVLNFVYFNLFARHYVLSINNGDSMVGEIKLGDEEKGIEEI